MPVLQANCLSCHGDKTSASGGLWLGNRNAMLKGGANGPAIDLKNPAKSLLVKAINYQGLQMPPSGKLPKAQIEILTRWVRMGAPFAVGTDKVAAPVAKHGPPQVNAETMSFWSFRPAKRPAVPQVRQTDWVKNPIDAFVLAKLESSGMKPAPRATRSALIRRAYYDLIGLPPSPDEVRTFAADTSANSYEKLIDRLLASPQYGEKWGRHWLDLVRFAETNSYERDGPKPNAWRYRDYVIKSLNEDKPYDQFVMEQLAGDELLQSARVSGTPALDVGANNSYTAAVSRHGSPRELFAPTTRSSTHNPVSGPLRFAPRFPDALIATGYFRLGIWDDEPSDPLQALYDDLDDIASTTGQVFLGLTVGCARCHDHKIDPMPQKDYYRFLSFFSGLTRFGERSPASIYEASLRPIAPEAETKKQRAEIVAHRAKVKLVERELSDIESRFLKDLSPVEKEEFKNEGARIDIARKHVPASLSQEDVDRYAKLFAEKMRIEEFQPAALDMALCVTELGSKPRPTHVLMRGNPHVEGDLVEPGFPSVLSPPAPDITNFETSESCGRRLALAKWIASPENPLTARVIVNRVWQYHFGRGIVRTPSNFGLMGSKPTHPELLDWLASELTNPAMDDGRWTMDDGSGTNSLAHRASRITFADSGQLTNDDRDVATPLTHRASRITSAFLPSSIVHRPSSNPVPWSLKRLHKLIMLSNTYQMASTSEPAALAKDPENDLMWRFEMRRLQAEEIRDSILAVNGSLNLQIGGPSIYTEIPKEVLAGQSRPGDGWGKSTREQECRRSVYVFVKRSLITPVIASFDGPETDFTCPVRFATTQPTQALGLLNSTFINEQARVFAAYLKQRAGIESLAQVRLALQRVLQREPAANEIDRGVRFIAAAMRDHKLDLNEALKQFCVVALSLNEFIYLD